MSIKEEFDKEFIRVQKVFSYSRPMDHGYTFEKSNDILPLQFLSLILFFFLILT